MSNFFSNICLYKECNTEFPCLFELIQHVETAHVDFTEATKTMPRNEKPFAIPLSYALPYFPRTNSVQNNAGNEACSPPSETASSAQEIDEINVEDDFEMPEASSYTSTNYMQYSLNNPQEKDPSGNSDSDDSWVLMDSKFIMKNCYRVTSEAKNGKSLACPVPGCRKRYKNINGMKYHSTHGHLAYVKLHKYFHCFCGKKYVSKEQLDNHKEKNHRIDEEKEEKEKSDKMEEALEEPEEPVRETRLDGLIMTSQMSQEVLNSIDDEDYGYENGCKIKQKHSLIHGGLIHAKITR